MKSLEILSYKVDTNWLRENIERILKEFPVPETHKSVTTFSIPSIYNKKPIIHFKEVTVEVSNTLLRIFEKSDEDIQKYINYRSLVIILFLQYYNETRSLIFASIMVCRILIHELKDLNDLDYFIEFVFLRGLLNHQSQIIGFLVMGLTGHPDFESINQLDNPFLNIPEEIDIGDFEIIRQRYILEYPDTIRIAKFNSIVEMPIELVLYQQDVEVVNLGYRTVGVHDKSIGTVKIRNALSTLFPGLKLHPRLRRSYPKATEEPDAVTLSHSSLQLHFEDDKDTSFLYAYQLISTYMPLRADTVSIALDHLASKKHLIHAYGDNIALTFSRRHEIEPAALDELGQFIEIKGLDPYKFKILEQNLELIASSMSHVFKLPTISITGVTVNYSLNSLKPLHDHLGNILELYGNEFIPLQYYMKDVHRQYCSMITTNNKLQIIFKSKYFSDNFDHFTDLSQIDAIMKSTGKEIAVSTFEEIRIVFKEELEAVIDDIINSLVKI